MSHRRGFILLPILILILSGCFRQASDSIEPETDSLSGGAQQVIASNTPDASTDEIVTDVPSTDDEQPNDTAPTEASDDGDTEPVIAVTASTEVSLTTPTTLPSSTPAAQPTTAEDTDSVTSPVEPVQLESPTPTFVTPQAAGGSEAITTPTPQPTATIESTPTDLGPGNVDLADVDEGCLYTVQRGDTLFRIARNNDTTVDAILAVNPSVNPNLIFEGDELILPDCEPGEDAAEADDDTETPEPVEETEEDDDTTVVGSPGELVHVVASGDTLSTIAQRYGVTIANIIEANSLTNPNRLSIGQELVIPQE